MIGVSESLIRHSRRVSTEPHVPNGQPVSRGTVVGQGGQGGVQNDAQKHQLIDNLLSTSPPLPAPPVMQPAQIQAQERELEAQMSRMRVGPHAQQRPSVNAITIDPAYAVIQPPTTAAQANSRSTSSTSSSSRHHNHPPPPSSTSDWFAKVEVAPRILAPVPQSFLPSSLSAALTDSGVLGRPSAMTRGTGEEFGRASMNNSNSNNPPSRSMNGESHSKNRLAQVNDTLTIFLHPYSDISVRPARIRLQLPPYQPHQSSNTSSPSPSSPTGNPTSDDILFELLQKWQTGELHDKFGLRAVLQPHAIQPSKWSLKMVDEDTIEDENEADAEDDEEIQGEGYDRMTPGEEVGMPEEDLPPLERQKPIRTFGVITVAMVPAEGCEHHMPAQPTIVITAPTSPTASAITASSSSTTSSSGVSINPASSPIQPSSRNPASSPTNLRRYESVRTMNSPTSPHASAASKQRAVSIFSGMSSLLDADGNPRSPHAQVRADRQQAMAHDPSRMSIFGAPNMTDPTSPHSNQKFYITVHIGDHESHILGLHKSQLLSDALALLSAKKHVIVAMKPENYRFTYVDPLLKQQNDLLKDMTRVVVSSLASDELNLIPRLGQIDRNEIHGAAATTPSLLAPSGDHDTSSSPSSNHHGGSIIASEAPSLSSFQFSLDTASNYCEYKVIKTNQRGKRQNRIFGMDRYKIYNKTQSGEEGDSGGGMFSFLQRRISSDQGGVSRAFRYINTIASVHVVSLRPTCFCISFKQDARKDSPIAQSREYETETKMECAEIVAKLRFLMAHATPADSNMAGSVGGGGLLAASLK